MKGCLAREPRPPGPDQGAEPSSIQGIEKGEAKQRRTGRAGGNLRDAFSGFLAGPGPASRLILSPSIAENQGVRPRFFETLP